MHCYRDAQARRPPGLRSVLLMDLLGLRSMLKLSLGSAAAVVRAAIWFLARI